MPQVDTNCQDICNDVPYTTWQNDCKTITKTKTMCDIVYQQQCQKVCKPVCQKVTTVTTTQVRSKQTGTPSCHSLWLRHFVVLCAWQGHVPACAICPYEPIVAPMSLSLAPEWDFHSCFQWSM
jgi:hypothetical protein